jgi:hypothetical protein
LKERGRKWKRERKTTDADQKESGEWISVLAFGLNHIKRVKRNLLKSLSSKENIHRLQDVKKREERELSKGIGQRPKDT